MFAFQVLRPKNNIFSTEIEKNLYTQLYLQVLCCGTREKQQFWISKTQSFHTKFSQTNKQQQQQKQTNKHEWSSVTWSHSFTNCAKTDLYWREFDWGC